MKHVSSSLLLFMFLCLFCACKETEKEKNTRLVKEWEGKALAFPSYSTFTIQGRDTVHFTFPHSEYKIVTYVDSLGCKENEFHFDRWKTFIHEVDSLTGNDVFFVFYFNTKDRDNLCNIAKRNHFIYPVCVDETDVFNHLNQFSKELHTQTFLLDEADQVITMGNPINDVEVKEKYMKIMANVME